MPHTNILLVDDHKLFRGALSLQLTEHGYNVTNADNGRDALKLISENQFDIILLDIKMPVMNGIDFLSSLREFDTVTKVIALTGLEDPSLVLHLLSIGANSFSNKNCELDELIHIIEQTLEDGECITNEIETALDKDRLEPDTISNLLLTPRERQILQLIYAGMSTKEIAVELELTVYTVDSYRKALMEKTRTRSIGELIGLAARTGLID